MDRYDDEQRHGKPAVELAVAQPGSWISRFDVLRLGLVGVENLRPSDRAPSPALEFSFRGTDFLLELEPGTSRLSDASATPIIEFTYSSSLTEMRYSLDRWDEQCDRLPSRRAVAYMVAMQICARSEERLRYGELFA